MGVPGVPSGMKNKSSKKNRKEHRSPAVVLTKPNREAINKRHASWNETPSQVPHHGGKPKKHGSRKKPALGVNPPG